MTGAPNLESVPHDGRRAVFGVLVLAFCNVVAVASTQIMNILVDPMKTELGISDVQFSLLQGAAFFVFASIFALPAAWVADRGLRRNVILFGVVGWTIATAASALSRDFGELFVARVFVGIGEVFLVPAGLSLINDFVPRRRLGIATAVFVSGMPLGAAAAMYGGGWLLSAWPELAPQLGLEAVSAWRAAFVACALFGLLAALLLLGIREPERRSSANASGHDETHAAGLIKHVMQYRLAYGGVVLGLLSLSFAAVAAMTWLPSLFVRSYGLGFAEVGRIMGFALLVFAGSGTWICGHLADLLETRGRSDAPILVMGGSVLGIALCAAVMASIQLLPVAVATLCVLCVFIMAPGAVGPLALGRLALPHLRARVFAVYLLLSNMLAGGLGPSSVALLTDRVFERPEAVGHSVAIVAVACALVSVAAFVVVMPAYLRRVRA